MGYTKLRKKQLKRVDGDICLVPSSYLGLENRPVSRSVPLRRCYNETHLGLDLDLEVMDGGGGGYEYDNDNDNDDYYGNEIVEGTFSQSQSQSEELLEENGSRHQFESCASNFTQEPDSPHGRSLTYTVSSGSSSGPKYLFYTEGIEGRPRSNVSRRSGLMAMSFISGMDQTDQRQLSEEELLAVPTPKSYFNFSSLATSASKIYPSRGKVGPSRFSESQDQEEPKTAATIATDDIFSETANSLVIPEGYGKFEMSLSSVKLWCQYDRDHVRDRDREAKTQSAPVVPTVYEEVEAPDSPDEPEGEDEDIDRYRYPSAYGPAAALSTAFEEDPSTTSDRSLSFGFRKKHHFDFNDISRSTTPRTRTRRDDIATATDSRSKSRSRLSLGLDFGGGDSRASSKSTPTPPQTEPLTPRLGLLGSARPIRSPPAPPPSTATTTTSDDKLPFQLSFRRQKLRPRSIITNRSGLGGGSSFQLLNSASMPNSQRMMATSSPSPVPVSESESPPPTTSYRVISPSPSPSPVPESESESPPPSYRVTSPPFPPLPPTLLPGSTGAIIVLLDVNNNEAPNDEVNNNVVIEDITDKELKEEKKSKDTILDLLNLEPRAIEDKTIVEVRQAEHDHDNDSDDDKKSHYDNDDDKDKDKDGDEQEPNVMNQINPDADFWNSDSTPASEDKEKTGDPYSKYGSYSGSRRRTKTRTGSGTGPYSYSYGDYPYSYDGESNKCCPFLSTEKGAIRFCLPGRIQHKTTIKVAHFPTGEEKNLTLNLKPDQCMECEEDCCPPGPGPECCVDGQNFGGPPFPIPVPQPQPYPLVPQQVPYNPYGFGSYSYSPSSYYGQYGQYYGYPPYY